MIIHNPLLTSGYGDLKDLAKVKGYATVEKLNEEYRIEFNVDQETLKTFYVVKER